MLMRMIYDDSLAQAAYLIGCQATGEAIVIDPQRDIDRYTDLAKREGLKIVAAAETHIHADFLSGVREFCEQTPAQAILSDEGGDDWDYRWVRGKDTHRIPYNHRLVRDGDELMIGHIRLRVLHTPGHTPEHICYEVTDLGGHADEPMGIVTGDFIFVGDVGRPDLLESAAGQIGAMEPSARTLSRSLRAFGDKPDYLQLWPGHGSGSACGKALGAVPQTTMGYEKRFNDALKLAGDEEMFVAEILSGQPEPPAYFARMKQENRMGPAVLDGLPVPQRCRPTDLRPDAVIIDTRPWDRFCAGHLPGSLSIVLNKSFSTVAGAYVKPTQNIVLVAEPGQVDAAVRMLVRVGLDRVGHWIPPELVEHAPKLRTTDEIDVKQLASQREPVVLDVRNAWEFEAGHIPGAVNVTYLQLPERLKEVPAGAHLYVNCRSGFRSARAVAYLNEHGYLATNIGGGFLAWEAGGYPVVREEKANR